MSRRPAPWPAPPRRCSFAYVSTTVADRVRGQHHLEDTVTLTFQQQSPTGSVASTTSKMQFRQRFTISCLPAPCPAPPRTSSDAYVSPSVADRHCGRLHLEVQFRPRCTISRRPAPWPAPPRRCSFEYVSTTVADRVRGQHQFENTVSPTCFCYNAFSKIRPRGRAGGRGGISVSW